MANGLPRTRTVRAKPAQLCERIPPPVIRSRIVTLTPRHSKEIFLFKSQERNPAETSCRLELTRVLEQDEPDIKRFLAIGAEPGVSSLRHNRYRRVANGGV